MAIRAHVIKDGRVVNTILVNSLDDRPDIILGDEGAIGDLWDGLMFTPTIPEPKSASRIIAELDSGDKKIIRAVLEGDTMRIDAWKSKAAELRSQL